VRKRASEITSTSEKSSQRINGWRVVGIRKAAIATAGIRIAASSFGSPIPPESRLVSA
jgi:hypothetical protein